MEEIIPDDKNCPSRGEISAIPCGLPTKCKLDDMFDDDDFGWLNDDDDVPDGTIGLGGESDLLADFDTMDDQVSSCYCQADPSHIPCDFTPCCLPTGVVLASREIQMKEVFKDNLLDVNGAPPKTQTLRDWCPARAAEHYRSYTSGHWIRVWRGQGHKNTIGWILLKSWDILRVGEINKEDCVREGRPNLTSKQFVDLFFPGLGPTDELYRVRFVFRVCRACK
jgi:hypothetical protein